MYNSSCKCHIIIDVIALLIYFCTLLYVYVMMCQKPAVAVCFNFVYLFIVY